MEAIRMSKEKGGYARYVGGRGNKPWVSKWRETGFQRYEFIQDIWIRIPWEEDFKDLEYMSRHNEEWEAKRRLASNDTTYDDLQAARPGRDPTDLNTDAARGYKAELKALTHKMNDVRKAEYERLPPAVKRAKAKLEKYLAQIDEEKIKNDPELKRQRKKLKSKGQNTEGGK